jgi:membrane-bound ClpP family serine protease
MILLIILFFVIGIIAIMFEAVLPFGISAVFGFAIIALSGYIAYMEFGLNLAILYCIIALVVALLVTRMVMRSGLRWMTLAPPRPRPADSNPAAAPVEEPVIGDHAVVVAPLRPTGTIEVRGQRLAARSISPEIELAKGRVVRLTAKDSIYWVVEALPDESEAP